MFFFFLNGNARKTYWNIIFFYSFYSVQIKFLRVNFCREKEIDIECKTLFIEIYNTFYNSVELLVGIALVCYFTRNILQFIISFINFYKFRLFWNLLKFLCLVEILLLNWQLGRLCCCCICCWCCQLNHKWRRKFLIKLCQ